MLENRICLLRIVPLRSTALSRGDHFAFGRSAHAASYSRSQSDFSLRGAQWQKVRVSPFYVRGAALPIPEFRTTRRDYDMFFLLKRTSSRLAHAGLALKISNQAGSVTRSSDERDGDMSYSSSGSSVLMEDTVIVGDKVSEAIS